MHELLKNGNHSYVEVLLGKRVNLAKVAKKLGLLKESKERDDQLQQVT